MSDDLFTKMLAELLDPDTVIHLGDTEETITLGEFMALAGVEIGRPAPPKRGSEEYRDTIRHVATVDDVEQVGSAIQCLYEDYGWRGVADLMVDWTFQIDHAEPFRDPRYREPLSGAVDIAQIVAIHPDEEQKLLLAADKKNRYVEEQGMVPHEAFQKALTETEEGLAFMQRWYPYWRAALRAAHTTHDQRAVLAEYFKAPERTDRASFLQAALVLATAAYGARHHDAMAARFERAAEGVPVSHDESITPGWGAGGGYLSRSFLRQDD